MQSGGKKNSFAGSKKKTLHHYAMLTMGPQAFQGPNRKKRKNIIYIVLPFSSLVISVTV